MISEDAEKHFIPGCLWTSFSSAPRLLVGQYFPSWLTDTVKVFSNPAGMDVGSSFPWTTGLTKLHSLIGSELGQNFTFIPRPQLGKECKVFPTFFVPLLLQVLFFSRARSLPLLLLNIFFLFGSPIVSKMSMHL